MRRGAGVIVIALACALALPTVFARPAAAFTAATLGPPSTGSGGPGTPVTYQYTWNAIDCGVSTDSLTIQLFWDSPDPSEMIGSGTADASCSGLVTGIVPNDTNSGRQPLPVRGGLRQHHREPGCEQRSQRNITLRRNSCSYSDTHSGTDAATDAQADPAADPSTDPAADAAAVLHNGAGADRAGRETAEANSHAAPHAYPVRHRWRGRWIGWRFPAGRRRLFRRVRTQSHAE